MSEKLLPHHNFSWLNKWQIKDFKDYLTLLKEGFLFNLDLDKIKVDWFNKRSLISYLYNKLDEIYDNKHIHSKLKEKIYIILKNVINYDYNKNDKTTEEVIKEVLQINFFKFKINQDVDQKLVEVFTTIYKKSSFLTRLDLMSVKGISSNEFKEIIYKELQLNWEEKWIEKKAIKKLNKVFSDTINIMKTNFKLNIPKNYENKTWNNLDDFIEFAFTTSDERKTWYIKVIDCAILKTMTVYNSILDNPLLLELDRKLENIIKTIKKIPWFYIQEETDWKIVFNYNNPKGWVPSHARWTISYRTKDDMKILLKLLYNRKYTKLDFFKDLLWFRIEVDNEKNWENAILLFKDLFENDATLKNKWLLNNDFIEKCKNNYWISVDKEKKAWTSEDYVNAAYTWNFKTNLKSNWVKTPAEIQVVYIWNKNESGYNKHEIYDTKKYISAISRIFWYVTLEDIKILIHHYWLKSWLEERWILYHLIAPKKWKDSFLMKTRFSTCYSCNYYLSRDVYDEKLKELYKDITTEYTPLKEEEFESIYQRYLSIKI